jgi:5,10-methylenetetrahydrofolate reductase
MKMKAIFTVEFKAEDGANARDSLDGALERTSKALKDSIEQGTPSAASGTRIRPNSTSIIVTSQVE